MQRIGIIGAGAWGTALAVVARRAGREVVLWARSASLADAINRDHVNAAYLPGIALDPAIAATGNLAEVAARDALLLAVPAQFVRPVGAALAREAPSGVKLVVCAKGIEQGSARLMTEVLAETLPGAAVAVLSGPTFAVEVALGLPTAVTLAAADAGLGEALMQAIGSFRFRPYLSDDVVGTEVGGAVKNVLAIACGIIAGREFGNNARAALITRGLAEMTRLAVALGGRAETMMGLSGVGDLALTCTSEKSRNYRLGMALGQGQALAAAMAARRTVAEGVFSAAAVALLAARHGIEMPISAAVDAILNHAAPIDGAIEAVLSRPFRGEALFETGR